MAMSDLISRLEQEAQIRVEAIQRKGDAEVRTIEAETARAVHEIMASQLERGRAARHVIRERELALARRQARARELEALHTQIGRIAARARALIPEMAASSAYGAALPSHAREALRFLEGMRPRVRCQAAFASLVQPVVDRCSGAQLVLDESVGPGILVEAPDGSVTVDNRLGARLARAETWLAIELTRKLRTTCLAAASAPG
jgi:vacuolar-type H+-ATPase subunit E/Vma4